MPARSATDPEERPSGSRPPAFAKRLLAWFDENRRDLPWRRTRDPWAIWVSEVMLQQTRVEAVRTAYERFVERFPTPSAFAEIDDDELLRAWRGLGYYRRARLLRDGARLVVAEHDGKVPADPDALGSLPGIGAYTRGAVASIAFGHAEPAIDGNVERVAARHRRITTDVKAAPAQRAVRAFVLDAMDTERAGDFNQALMELGAVVCTPTSPRCGECPVAADCEALSAGAADTLPVRKPRRAAVDVTSHAVLVLGKRGALGARVPAGEPNAGQIELPGAGILVSVDPADLATILRQRYAARIEVGAALTAIRHAITHHRITYTAHAGDAGDRGRLRWFALDEGSPWTTAARKVFSRVAPSADEA